MTPCPSPPDPPAGITWGLLALLGLGAVMVVILFSSSCAQLEAIPFSVSYQTRDGATVTITKPRIIREK